MIPKLYTQSSSDEILLYNNIYSNIEDIRNKYDDLLNPNSNNITKFFLKENCTPNQAYSLAFMLTVKLYCIINKNL